MIYRGREACAFGPFEAKHVLAWIYPLASFVLANCGAELLGLLKEHGLSRSALSAALVLVLRYAYLFASDNSQEVVT